MSKTVLKSAVCALALLGLGQTVTADQDADLVVNGEIEITVRAAAPDHVPNLRTIYSGWTFRSTETQALQMDDFDNPGFIGVDQGQEFFDTPIVAGGESCASCHENAESLRGVRAVYPKWDEEHGEVQTLEMQINECVTERMGAEALKYTGGDMVNLTALIASVSRGLPINVAIDGPAAETWEAGRDLYYTRTGQLELSCANCHEDNYDNMIRADHLSQGHINGFPVYRLKNARLNAVHSRFRGCVRDTRAETYAVGSPEFVALELYLASRGNGLSVEGPSVRN